MLIRRGPSLRAMVVVLIGVAVNVGLIAVVAIVVTMLASGLLVRGGTTRCLAAPEQDELLTIPGCPALLLPDDLPSIADYADVVRWQGVDYLSGYAESDVPKRQLGKLVTVVGCNVGELELATGRDVAAGPWPDRTATGLPIGTELRAITGQPTECRLAAVVADEVRVYVAVDDEWQERC